MSRVVVAGAGLAGLTAALDLQDRGHEVELLERSRLLGGKTTSFRVDGVEVDGGQHVHLACCTAFTALVARLGMADMLHLQERFDVLVLERNTPPARLRASRLPAPLHLLGAFARYRPLPPRDRLRVALALAAARTTRSAPGTALAWLRRRHQSPAALRAFWEPFLVPALNAQLDLASADAALFTIRTAFLGGRDAARIGWSTVPLARIAEAAAARLTTVRLRTPVVGLLGAPPRVQGVRLEDGSTLRADAVVLAIPPRRLRRVLGDPARWGVTGLDSLTTQPIIDVHLWFDPPDPPAEPTAPTQGTLGADFAALLASPVQWVFEKSPGYLCASLSAATDTMALTEPELVALCHAELLAACPALAAHPLRHGAAVRDPEATFVPAPGLQRPGPTTRAPNLTIAGAFTNTGWPATMESAVRSGTTAAAALRIPATAPPEAATAAATQPASLEPAIG